MLLSRAYLRRASREGKGRHSEVAFRSAEKDILIILFKYQQKEGFERFRSPFGSRSYSISGAMSAQATAVISRFSKRNVYMAEKAKKNLGKKKLQTYPVCDEVWQVMQEEEREVIRQARTYKEEIDWLLEAERLAVAALLEHHAKERKALIEAHRYSRKQSHAKIRKARRRLERSRKRKKVGRVPGIKRHPKVGGGMLMKKPARQAK